MNLYMDIKKYSIIYWIRMWILKNDQLNLLDSHLDFIGSEFVMNLINNIEVKKSISFYNKITVVSHHESSLTF